MPTRPRFQPRIEILEDRLAPANFIVTTTADAVAPPAGSLRAAITNANAAPGPNSITFAIPPTTAPFTVPQVINLVAALPTITNTVAILGDTQPGFTDPSNINTDPFFNSPFPPIVVNGAGAGAGANGLSFTAAASGSVVQWVQFLEFSGNGLLFTGSANDLIYSCVLSGNGGNGIAITGATATGNRVENCFIGTDQDGNVAIPNALNGVLIDQGASNNVIGGGNFFELRNIIAGNGANGIHIANGSSGNLVQADVIGVNTGNNTAIPNQGDGVLVDGNGTNNEIGGPIGLGNIISGNNGNGIEVAGTVSNTTVFNAFAGVSAFSNVVLGNKLNGMLITSSGGGTVITTNIVSGNGAYGLRIGGNANGVTITMTETGVNFPGIAAVPNGQGGLLITDNATNVTVGLPKTTGTTDARNTFSGNIGDGIDITGNASNISIPINEIGLDAFGRQAIPNTGNGIVVGPTARNVTIGGGAGANGVVGNTIAFNGGAGIVVSTGNTSVTILQNLIFSNVGPNLVVPGVTTVFATGAGAGGGPQVNVYSSTTGQLIAAFNAFAAGFTGGVRVAMGDVTGDGVPDIIAAAGPGGGPQVTVFDGKTLKPIMNFFAFAPTFAGGVFVAAGDVNGDGFSDIIVGADAGGSPEVRVFSGKDGSLLRDFFAFSPFFLGGVRVAAADFNTDGKADIVVAAGLGGGPQVTVFDGSTLLPLTSFFAFASTFTGGVFVASGDTNGDGVPDIIAGTGAGVPAQVAVFDGKTFASHGSFAPFGGFAGGVTVAATDVNGDGKADIVAGAGPGGGPQVSIFDGATLAQLSAFFAYNAAFAGGVFVGAPR